MRELFESLDDDHQGQVSYDELCKALFPTQDWDRLRQLQLAATYVQAHIRGFLTRKQAETRAHGNRVMSPLAAGTPSAAAAAAAQAICSSGEGLVKSARRVARSARRSRDPAQGVDPTQVASGDGSAATNAATSTKAGSLSSMLRRSTSGSSLPKSPSASGLQARPSSPGALRKTPAASRFAAAGMAAGVLKQPKVLPPSSGGWDEAHESRLIALEKMMHRCCGIAELLLADTLRRGVDSSPPSGTAALARRPIALAAPLASGADVPIERSDSVISRADSSAVVLEVENA